MGQMLTVKQVAEVKGCRVQYIQRMAKEGKLPSVKTVNNRNQKVYQIPLESLPDELQQRWYQMQVEQMREENGIEEENRGGTDQFSAEERLEIDFWLELVRKWQEYRNLAPKRSKGETDQKFLIWCSLEYPDRTISMDILYRKWKAVRENNMAGLTDKRGKWRKGTSDIHETVWQAFLYYYLDEGQHTIQKCLEYTKMWIREKQPELYTDIPSYSSFYRRLNRDIPEGVKVLGREGHKAYNDRCAPYIRRIYEDIASNEWWIADNHTFDVIVVDKNGKQHRPYLTAFMDARSGILTGYYITYNPSSEATLIALRKGILEAKEWRGAV